MSAASITVTPVLVADLQVEGERMPVYVHVIDHPDARVLVDTGMTALHTLKRTISVPAGVRGRRTEWRARVDLLAVPGTSRPHS